MFNKPIIIKSAKNFYKTFGTPNKMLINQVIKDLNNSVKTDENRMYCSKELNDFILKKSWINERHAPQHPWSKKPFTAKNDTTGVDIVFLRYFGNKIYKKIGSFMTNNPTLLVKTDKYLIEVIEPILNKYNIKKIRMDGIYDNMVYEKDKNNNWVTQEFQSK
jgi:hypothetical protein